MYYILQVYAITIWKKKDSTLVHKEDFVFMLRFAVIAS